MKNLEDLGILMPLNPVTQHIASEQIIFGQRLMRVLITGVAETGELIEALENARIELIENNAKLYTQIMEKMENE